MVDAFINSLSYSSHVKEIFYSPLKTMILNHLWNSHGKRNSKCCQMQLKDWDSWSLQHAPGKRAKKNRGSSYHSRNIIIIWRSYPRNHKTYFFYDSQTMANIWQTVCWLLRGSYVVKDFSPLNVFRKGKAAASTFRFGQNWSWTK